MKKVQPLLLAASVFFVPTLTEAQSTYNDVADIFYAHCTYCHHDGGIAPFSLMNYEEVSSYANSIHASVNNETMPPFHADTAYTTSGRTVEHFINANYLTYDEKMAILNWVEDGALEGESSEAPESPLYGNLRHKLNGKDDLTLQIPTYRSNATPSNLNPYDCFVVPTNLTEDRWLRAFEIVPGNLQAVHHVVITIDTTNSVNTDTSGNCANQGGQFGIGGWTPGAAPTIFPNKEPFKTGIRIPAGSNFIFQMHYAPYSDGMVDSTKVRLFFYDEAEENIRPMYSNTLIQRWDYFGVGGAEFPAGTKTTHKATTATSQFLRPHPQQPSGDFTIFSVNPHSHSVCTKIKNYAYKGTDTIPIISIPNWDFNWEGNYYFAKPVLIPAGYTLEADHLYDNTTANTHLEGKIVDVKYGLATGDEMLFDSFLYVDYQPGDENIDLKSMIESDTLLYVGVKEFSTSEFKTSIYPNPATSDLHIYLSATSDYIGRITNLLGQTVQNITEFQEKIKVDISNIPAGIYIIEITDLESDITTGKKLVITK